MDKKRNIVLIGMPASGKSTIGVLLAKELGLDFVDLDIVIQTGEGKTLAEIIAQKGMQEFLKIEEKYLVNADYCGFVIAPGGSSVYSAKGMDSLRKTSIIIYFNLSLKFLKKRLSSLDARGVVRTPGQNIEDIYNERALLYEKYADIIFDCDFLTPDQIVSGLMTKMTNQGNIIQRRKNE